MTDKEKRKQNLIRKQQDKKRHVRDRINKRHQAHDTHVEDCEDEYITLSNGRIYLPRQ